MYYPYLRGKQFELLALREFVDIYSGDCRVFPIIEPVNENCNSIKIAIRKLQEKDIDFGLILNPQVGDLKNKPNYVYENLNELLGLNYKWSPAFIVNTHNSRFIINLINDNILRDVMLICNESIDVDDFDFDEMINKAEITKVLINNNNRSLKRKLDRIHKAVIRLDDSFNPQKKNADYLDITEERFTEEHRYYASDGYIGFGDYTTLISDYSEGGRLPYAVAIHITYEKNEFEIWIRHFVSDTNDDNTNIQGKFGEAAEKAVAFFESIHKSNNAITELTRYFRNEQYPGLGVLKKISIKNHLELMNGILTSTAL
jgi:hypothetical protein